ncbi:MAG: MmgE/PrpD family protein [Solirubrobacterales bacterium]
MSGTKATGAGAAELLARVDAFDAGQVPDEVREHAARVLADTIGAAMAGHREPEMAALLKAPSVAFGTHGPADRGAALLVPGAPSAAAGRAALMNGAAGTFLELDEGSRPTGHPAVHIVPAALAAGQVLNSSGRELLDAIILGYEVSARLFTAYGLRFPLHCHGNLANVGAAVAVARLRGRPCVEPALVAASFPLLTVWQPCFEGATVRNTWSGVGAFLGLLANELADSGFTGSVESLEAAFGGLVGEEVNPSALSDPIDPTRMRIIHNYFKLHSCCASSHSAIDAVLSLPPLDPEEVESIEVETVSNNLKIDRDPVDAPLSRRFSFGFAVATALLHGHADPDAFVADRRVLELAEKVSVGAAPEFDRVWPDAGPARVTVHLADSDLTALVENPYGHWRNPPSPQDLRHKFERVAGVADPEALYETITAVDDLPNLEPLVEALARSRAEEPRPTSQGAAR